MCKRVHEQFHYPYFFHYLISLFHRIFSPSAGFLKRFKKPPFIAIQHQMPSSFIRQQEGSSHQTIRRDLWPKMLRHLRGRSRPTLSNCTKLIFSTECGHADDTGGTNWYLHGRKLSGQLSLTDPYCTLVRNAYGSCTSKQLSYSSRYLFHTYRRTKQVSGYHIFFC